jgi:hypothetical protein
LLFAVRSQCGSQHRGLNRCFAPPRGNAIKSGQSSSWHVNFCPG